MLLIGQELELNVGVAGAGIAVFRRKIPTFHHAYYQRVFVAFIPRQDVNYVKINSIKMK